MPEIDEKSVLGALEQIVDPSVGKDIVALGLVSGVAVRPGEGGAHVTFVLEVDPARGTQLEELRQQAERAVRAIPGVTQVAAVLTAHRKPPAAPPRPARHISLPNIRFMIAVASGKGGVGKSTTAVNLALALAAQKLRVGLLDADIYGPSIPRMLGVTKKPENEGGMLQPVMAMGLKIMSIGFMVAEDSPVIWRGPMVQGALLQMLRDVAWGTLDVLVIDMPPGTGDAQLTLAQQVPLAGAVIVSTPQDIALIDARKGLNMFRRVDVPVLGIIENMSYFVCPHCETRSEIFSHGGARVEAARMGCDFLGEIPLELRIRQSMDEGKPIVAAEPESPPAGIYNNIAERIWEKLLTPEQVRPAPKIAIN
ncbi:MAG: iron-sulfur cluster carrier protein ApbC [Alphaproteobacteria bacterium]